MLSRIQIFLVVALRKESVDRNLVAVGSLTTLGVALRKESVDRNLWWGVRKAVGSLVALRKESVDRNIPPIPTSQTSSRSLSARRAWIEISRAANCQHRSHRRSPQGERG